MSDNQNIAMLVASFGSMLLAGVACLVAYLSKRQQALANQIARDANRIAVDANANARDANQNTLMATKSALAREDAVRVPEFAVTMLHDSVRPFMKFLEHVNRATHEMNARHHRPATRTAELEAALGELGSLAEAISEEQISALKVELGREGVDFSANNSSNFMDAVRKPLVEAWRTRIADPMLSSFVELLGSRLDLAGAEPEIRRAQIGALQATFARQVIRCEQTINTLLFIGHSRRIDEQRKAFQGLAQA